jgi:hypothetical protein
VCRAAAVAVPFVYAVQCAQVCDAAQYAKLAVVNGRFSQLGLFTGLMQMYIV